MNKMFLLVATALGTDTIAQGINALSNPDPTFVVRVLNALINAVIAVAAVLHLVRNWNPKSSSSK